LPCPFFVFKDYSGTRLPEDPEKMAAFKERMRQLMEYRKEEWPYEYEHWKQYWGLE